MQLVGGAKESSTDFILDVSQSHGTSLTIVFSMISSAVSCCLMSFLFFSFFFHHLLVAQPSPSLKLLLLLLLIIIILIFINTRLLQNNNKKKKIFYYYNTLLLAYTLNGWLDTLTPLDCFSSTHAKLLRRYKAIGVSPHLGNTSK